MSFGNVKVIFSPTMCEMKVAFTPDYVDSGTTSTAHWSNELLRRSLHRAFRPQSGEMLTGVRIDQDGIRGTFVSNPERKWSCDAEMICFSKRAKNFAGRDLCFRLMLDDLKQPLPEQRGKYAKFYARPEGTLVKLRAYIPPGISVPQVDWTEIVLVRFQCTRGSSHFGNQVTSIEIF